MDEKRHEERVIPRDFEDFTVELRNNYLTLIGSPGNVSEEGMLLLVRAEGEIYNLSPDTSFRGTIRGRGMREKSFEGHVAWTDFGGARGRNYQYIGIQFEERFVLPNVLLAFEMARLVD